MKKALNVDKETNKGKFDGREEKNLPTMKIMTIIISQQQKIGFQYRNGRRNIYDLKNILVINKQYFSPKKSILIKKS